MAESRYIGHLIKEAKSDGKKVVVIKTKEELNNLMSKTNEVKNTIVIIDDVVEFINKNK